LIGGVLERDSTGGKAVFARAVYWREGQTEMSISQAGAAWTFIQSFFTMVAFCTFISKLAKLLSQDLPNSVFDYKALLSCGYFDAALQIGTIVVVDQQGVIAKINLPCFFLSLSATLFSLEHFGVACVLLQSFSSIMPIHTIPLHLFYLLFLLLTALGRPAFNSIYRVRSVVTFLVQYWMFAWLAPYPSSMPPPRWRLLYAVNQMAGGYQGQIAHTKQGSSLGFADPEAEVCSKLSGGVVCIQKMQTAFEDVV
jgi:lipopolysaccharide transport system permease protein